MRWTAGTGRLEAGAQAPAASALPDVDRRVHLRVLGLGAAVATLAYPGYALVFFLHGLRGVATSLAVCALLAWAIAGWAWRRRREKTGVRLLCVLFFVQLSWLASVQAGVRSPALWWLSAIPFICLLAGLYVQGLVMAGLYVVEIAVLYQLQAAGRLPVHRGVWTDFDLQVAAAATGSMLLVMVFIVYSLRSRNEVQKELERSRAEMLAAVEAKGRFLANMSHEIRTPLNGLVGAADLLRLPTLTLAQRSQLVGLQQQCSKTVLTLVDDMLAGARLQAGTMTLDPRPLDLHALVFETNQLFSVTAFDKGLELTSSCDPRVPRRLLADAARMRQVVNNLVSNAVKFTERGGVHIHLGLDGTPCTQVGAACTVRIDVHDSGIGLSDEERSALFGAFGQVDRGITRRFGGSGLGLSICRDLAALMGGRLDVESAPGRGSRFSLVVPLTAAELAAPLPPPHAQAIVVCASDGLARHVGGLLREQGIEPLVHPSLPEAGAIDAARTPWLFVDAALFAADGHDALNALERLHAAVRVVLLAPLGSDSVLGPLEPLALLYKPVRRSSLVALLGGASESEPQRPSAPLPLPLGPLGLRVLVVEDNVVNQLVAETMLGELGCSSVLAADGGEALAALERERFDVVLMDLQMPVMDGLTATRALREREAALGLPRTPVIAMTASTEAEVGRGEAGFDGYLGKPFVLRQLRQCLERHARPARP